MNIRQMHIEFNLSLQKIGANVKRKFIDEEVDWILNKQISRFVFSKIKPDPNQRDSGFQSTEIDLDALRTLVELDVDVDVYKNIESEVNFVFAELPGNYSYMIRSESGIVRNCHATYNAAKNFVATSEFIYKIKIPETTKVVGPFYTNTTFKTGTLEVVPAGAFPASLVDKRMNFVLQDVLQNNLYNSETYNIYWERYKNMFEPETLLIASKTPLNNFNLLYDAINHMSESVSKLVLYPQDAVPVEYRSNRLPRSNKVADFQDSSFAKSQWKSPISAISGNTLKVYHDDKFIVNRVRLNYIRKPQLVSLSLGKGCDLPTEYHQQICDLAVEYVKQAIADPNYPWKLQDNKLRSE